MGYLKAQFGVRVDWLFGAGVTALDRGGRPPEYYGRRAADEARIAFAAAASRYIGVARRIAAGVMAASARLAARETGVSLPNYRSLCRAEYKYSGGTPGPISAAGLRGRRRSLVSHPSHVRANNPQTEWA